MAALAPGAAIAGVDHALGTQHDLVQAADLEARVVEAAAVGMGEGEHVMVAVAGGAQEGERLAADGVGDPHPQHPL